MSKHDNLVYCSMCEEWVNPEDADFSDDGEYSCTDCSEEERYIN